MRIFISYRFTGENPEELNETMKNICDILERKGHKTSCSLWKGDFFKKNNFTNKKILEYALKELDDSDIYLAFIKSKDKSEGMLIEAGYALAKGKKFVLVIKKDIKTTFMHELANKIIKFKDLKDFYEKLDKTIIR